MSNEKLPVWNLGIFFESNDDPALQKALEAMTKASEEFEAKWRGNIAGADGATLARAVADYEKASRTGLEAYAYSHLAFADNSEDQKNVALSVKVRQVANEAHRRTLFFTLEMDEMEEAHFQEIVKDPALASHFHFLKETRRMKPHRLTEPEENILVLKSLTGKNAFVQLYSRVTNGFRFPSPLEEGKELTGPEMLALMKHTDPDVRLRAMESYYKVYAEAGTVLSTVWNTLAQDHRQDMELRNFTHPMEPVNERNELTGAAVDALMQTTRDHYGLARRYYKWKARTMGVERLRSCDLVAPLPGDEPDPLSFDSAKEMVLDAYGDFHESFRDIASDFFTERRIDAPTRPGKSGGAFCMGAAPDIPPFILMNYTGKLRDAATLAHELGHGIHDVLASKQPLLEYGPVLPLAETASVFGELLLNQKLAKQDMDPVKRRNLIAERVEDIIATTFRQAMYTDFELQAHLKIAENQLSADEFCDIWSENLDNLYGDAVDKVEASRWTWSAIPHFVHTRFYCYAYTFGELLTLAFFRRYQEEGDAFAPKFIDFLSAGGSKSPPELVAHLGYDLEDREFWAGGYKVLEQLIEELEQSD